MFRTLGATENTTWMLDRICPVSPTIVASISGQWEERELRAALDRIQAKHALLRLRIAPWSRRFAESDRPIPLKIADRKREDEWVEAAEWEANHIVDWKNGPLARVVWLRSDHKQDLLLSLHHVAGDGRGCLFLLQAILEELSGVQGADSVEFPSLESLLPAKYRGRKGLQRALAFIGKSIPFMTSHPIPRLSRQPFVDPKSRRSRLFHQALSVEDTQALVEAADRSQMNLHSLICAAMLKALGDALSLDKAYSLGCMSAVDLRRLLKPSMGEGLGSFISMIPTYHRLPQDLWELAGEIKHEQWMAFRRGDPLASIPFQGLLFARIPFPSWLRRVVELAVPPAIGVSDLGKVAFPEKIGGLHVEALNFVGPTNPLFAGQGFAAGVLVFRNRLFLNLGSSEPVLSAHQSNDLVEGTRRYLNLAMQDA